MSTMSSVIDTDLCECACMYSKLDVHTLPAILAEGLHTAQIQTALFHSDTS